MRFSDIYKNKDDESKKAKEKPVAQEGTLAEKLAASLDSNPDKPIEQPKAEEVSPQPQKSVFPAPAREIFDKENIKREKIMGRDPEPSVKLSQCRMPSMQLLDETASRAHYEYAVDMVRTVYEKLTAGDDISALKGEILDCLSMFISQQSINNDNIFKAIYSQPVGNYIFYHVVNVCILSIDIAIGLGYQRKELMELAIIAFFHDVEMLSYADIYMQPRKLDKAEYEQIKKHSVIRKSIVQQIMIFSDSLFPAIQQVHERVDASGYPLGLGEDQIHPYAKIMSLVDIYEAMTHDRPHRKNIRQSQVLKELVEVGKNCCDRQIIKILLQRNICPYALDSYVNLSTGEKAKVVMRNVGSPLRPVVEVEFDDIKSGGEKSVLIDLSKHTTIYIQNLVEE